MKKTITILLLTVLCLTVLTSCDFSRGLSGEMFGQSLEIDPQVGEIYTTDGGWNTKCECTDADHHGGYNYPETEIATETEIWTEGCEETWDDDICTMPPVQEPMAVYVVINCIDVQFMIGDDVCIDKLYISDTRDEPDRAGVVLEGDLSISYGGWIAMVGVDGMLFGYSFDKESEPIYSESFSVEATPEVLMKVEQVGGTYAAAFYVSIPADELKLGAQRVYLWAYNEQTGFSYRFCELEVIKAEGIR